MIEHSNAIIVLEEHFKMAERQPIEAKIKDRPLFVKPLNCRAWHELQSVKGMDYNIRLIQLAVVYEDGTPVLMPTDLYRLEDRVDGAVITALANMAFEKITAGVNDLKNGFRRPEENG